MNFLKITSTSLLKKISLFIFFLFLSAAMIPPSANANNKIYINVGAAKVKKSLMALPQLQFFGTRAKRSELKIGQDLYAIVFNDLQASGLFQFIDPKAFLEDTRKVGLKPAPGAPNGFSFNNWKTIGTELLVRAGYRIVGNKIELETYLYYVPQAKNVFGKKYIAPLSSLRKLAHSFSNDIVKNLTGRESFFNSKLVVAARGPREKFRSIYVMDWDGKNRQKISNHNSVTLSPTWSHDGDHIAYTAYAYHPKAKIRNADLFMYQISTKKRWLVSYRKGINSGADFMPDDQNLLLTISQGGNPDIFFMSRDGKKLRRLTRGPGNAMNVEPNISPDGQTIAFSSDRSGNPMIYTMGLHSKAAKRITDAGKYNSSPSWSPDGKKIAFAGFDKGHFDIFTMNANGTGLKRLTAARKKNGRGANNETPTWSPDGRYIMFTSDRSGKNQIYIVGADGNNERRITFDSYDYSKPQWSPKNK